jgi:hypothetical protein
MHAQKNIRNPKMPLERGFTIVYNQFGLEYWGWGTLGQSRKISDQTLQHTP